MDTSEILELHEWYKIHVIDAGMPTLYAALIKALNQVVAPNTQNVPYTNQVNSLITSTKTIPTKSLSITQINLLTSLGVLHLLDEKGSEYIEQNIKAIGADYARLIEVVTSWQLSINSSNQKLTAAAQGLAQLGFKASSSAFEKNTDAYTVITFKQGSSINNIADLKNFSKEWYLSADGISEFIGEKPENFKMLKAENGSLILYIGVSLQALWVFNKMLGSILKHAESFHKIKLLIEQTRLAGVQADRESKLLEILEEENAANSDKIVDLVADDLILDKNVEPSTLGKIKSTIKRAMKFQEAGGTIDPRLIEKDKQKITNKEKLKQYEDAESSLASYQETTHQIDAPEVLKGLEFKEDKTPEKDLPTDS